MQCVEANKENCPFSSFLVFLSNQEWMEHKTDVNMGP